MAWVTESKKGCDQGDLRPVKLLANGFHQKLEDSKAEIEL